MRLRREHPPVASKRPVDDGGAAGALGPGGASARETARAGDAAPEDFFARTTEVARDEGAGRAAVLALAASHPVWEAVLSSTRNRERAEIALDLFRARVPLDASLVKDAAVLVWASGTTRDAQHTEGLVTPVQGTRALEKLRALPPSERARVDGLLQRTGSLAERAVVLKGLAARFSRDDPGAVVDELAQLAARVRGRSLEELVQTTTGYGLAEALGDPPAEPRALDGEGGVQQAFTQSCGPSVRLLAEAEIDPALALRLVDDVRAGADPRSLSAEDQRRWMDASGAPAIPRTLFGQLRHLLTRERGTNLGTYLDTAYQRLGVTFLEVPWDRVPADKRMEKLDVVEARVRAGLDVPVHVDVGGAAGHYVCIVDAATLQGRRAWRVHDPDTGRSRWISDEDLLRGAVGGGRALTRLYVPHLPEP